MNPGSHYFPPCGHIQCRACITEQHAREARLESPLACSICRTHLPVSKVHIHVSEMVHSSDYLTTIRNMNIFYNRSPYYAAREAFLLDRSEYQEFLTSIYRTAAVIHQPPDPNYSTFGITHDTIYGALLNCLEDRLRMCYPDLLVTELMLVFDDVLVDFMVYKPGALHHDMLSSFQTEDIPLFYRQKEDIVKGLKKVYPYLGRLEVVWEEIMRTCAAALVVKWSRRFITPCHSKHTITHMYDQNVSSEGEKAICWATAHGGFPPRRQNTPALRLSSFPGHIPTIPSHQNITTMPAPAVQTLLVLHEVNSLELALRLERAEYERARLLHAYRATSGGRSCSPSSTATASAVFSSANTAWRRGGRSQADILAIADEFFCLGVLGGEEEMEHQIPACCPQRRFCNIIFYDCE
ncbi:hypothetical protein DE146DRAFT_777842 [Phaeosphaeria sp. MPI-PUGE-AT-0046c]|nr:hypothetical protein DE146DRAFT_777842 [Phaeosphaeria sp. MPI-PUGE-AT-0046c]